LYQSMPVSFLLSTFNLKMVSTAPCQLVDEAL
jgi:hypothetical protein